MVISRFALALAACGVLVLSACSSTDSASSESTSSAAGSDSTTSATACPTAAGSAAPEWTYDGSTGKVAVTGSTDEAAPKVDVTTPFATDKTEVHVLREGTGPVVSPTATVSVCYVGVNGRNGSVFDSSYDRGAPEQFSLDGVVPGFQKAIAGQKVGSTVAVAMVPADGYPEGESSAGIEKGDTLVFALKILSAS
ncbi:FKBP-type peptidyl-prolyl cis-trans isomerase [Gordonia soli]|uniref:Peptidyl-prolyl cis-trans isomerase n=1 Tax=Gordonia soli NBRC 108243 TaxID=1223545 RepID=M0QD01_9ACTN|nr:FKBP-type peptidyl-prolyl cis-trans isomerase [Gordonia soli]GAC66430.1 hypothetical protein GS4_02_01410 [Gordonia soli NBRC 108243]